MKRMVEHVPKEIALQLNMPKKGERKEQEERSPLKAIKKSTIRAINEVN